MSVRTAIAVLNSMFDLFQEIGGGVSLGANVREIARRLRMVQVEAETAWSADLALKANQLRTRSAHYAMSYASSAAARPAITARLNEVVRAYSELLAHLEMHLEPDAALVDPHSRFLSSD